MVATVSMLIESQWREGAKTYERAAILRKVAQLLLERADGIAEIMSRETGKAINDARAEVIRSQDTINLSAEEAIRIGGEQVSFDAIRRLRVGGVIINGTSTWRTDRSRSAT